MIDLDDFLKQGPLQANRWLLDALKQDTERAELYRQLRQRRQLLRFTSTADAGSPGQPVYRQEVVLLALPEHIERALTQAEYFSNSPYRALGSGSFMLGLDGPLHAAQRTQGGPLLAATRPYLPALTKIAWDIAAVLPLKQRSFDAALLAEQVALRFAGLLFGLPPQDHVLLETAMRLGYQQLTYQIVGRHFEPQPLLDTRAKLAGGALATRMTELLGEYLRGDAPKDIQELQHKLPGFVPLLQALAREPGGATLAELTVLAGGLIAGTIGNVQASVAIALDHLLDDTDLAALFRIAGDAAAPDGQPGNPSGNPAWVQLQTRVLRALALNPPAALLPRKLIQDLQLDLGDGRTATLAAGTELLLAIGSATAERLQRPAAAGPDALIYGGDGGHLHACLGAFIGTPLVVRIVRNILRLRGLTRAIDPRSGQALRLEKTWGFRCDKLALEYAQDIAMVQSPLAIIMPVRAPVAVNAELLKTIIAVGAPRIEIKLAESRQVHFAWFLLLDNDSQLALFTTFDGDFDTYLKHFALEVGTLFDKLFECLADPPPMPVAQYPDEFVAKVRQYHRRPLGGYFFSAYPQAPVARIQAALTRELP